MLKNHIALKCVNYHKEKKPKLCIEGRQVFSSAQSEVMPLLLDKVMSGGSGFWFGDWTS